MLEQWSLIASGLIGLAGAYLAYRGTRQAKRIDSVDGRIDTAFEQNEKTITRQDARIGKLELMVAAQAEVISTLTARVASLALAESDLRFWAVDATNWMTRAELLLRQSGIAIEKPPPFPVRHYID